MPRLLPFLILLCGCALGAGNLESRHSSDLSSRNIKRVAIFNLQAISSQPRGSDPYTASRPRGGTGADQDRTLLLTHLLYRTMAELPSWQIVSDREVSEMEAGVPPGSDRDRTRKLGELVFADAVISGRLLRYRERVGEEWGAKSPASVAFVLDLWDVKRGDLIWSARFDETQKPLSENLFGLADITQRGVRWLKAEELMHEGVKKAVTQLHQILHRQPS